MSDKRKHLPAMCGTCARVTQRDLDRGYCPVSAAHIRRNKPADRCRFFVESEDCDAMRGRGKRHVR